MTESYISNTTERHKTSVYSLVFNVNHVICFSYARYQMVHDFVSKGLCT